MEMSTVTMFFLKKMSKENTENENGILILRI